MNTKAVEEAKKILEALDSRDKKIVEQAEEYLKDLADPAVFQALLENLKFNRETTRLEVATKLLAEGYFEASSHILDLIKSGSFLTRARAIGLCGKYQLTQSIDLLIEVLWDKNEKGFERVEAAHALAKLGGDKAFDALTKVFLDHLDTAIDYASSVRQGVATALILFNPPKPELFLSVIKHPDTLVRFNAIAGLGHFKEKLAIPLVIEAFNDNEVEVRKKAFWALGEIGETSVNDKLYEVVVQEKFEELRVEGWLALGKLKDVRAVEPLLEILAKKDVRLKMEGRERSQTRKAVELLGNLGDKRAIPYLLPTLKSKYGNMRVAGIEALIKLADESILPDLMEAQQDSTKLMGGEKQAKEAIDKAIQHFQAH
jgi:HEAT repeat protein